MIEIKPWLPMLGLFNHDREVGGYLNSIIIIIFMIIIMIIMAYTDATSIMSIKVKLQTLFTPH